MVKVYGVKLLDDLRFLEMRGLFHACLPKEVCDVASKFKFIAGKQRKVLGELLLRAIVFRDYGIPSADLVIDTTEKGKPYLASHPHIHFNISHSGGWVVIAFSLAKVGVDVEKIRNVNLGIAQRFFSEGEKQHLFSLPAKNQVDNFFDLWTLKESFLKAIGTGLTKPLKSFTIQQKDEGFCLTDNEYYKHVFLNQIKIEKNYKLSVCGFEDEIVRSFTAFYINDLLEILNS